MLKKIKGSVKALMVVRSNKQNEEALEGVLNGKDDQVQDLLKIAQIVAIMIAVFAIFLIAMPELGTTIVTWLKSNFSNLLK